MVTMTHYWHGGYDHDRDDRMNKSEMRSFLMAYGMNYNRISYVMKKMNKNFDNFIDSGEMEQWFKRKNKRSVFETSKMNRDDSFISNQSLGGKCNGHADLCDRRYNNVTYACTHNAYNSVDDNYFFANQYKSILSQLHHGIRSFMVDVYKHPTTGRAVFCHGGYITDIFCPFGNRNGADVMRPMHRWLKEHSEEVITFIVENSGYKGITRCSADDIEKEFTSAFGTEILYDPTQALYPSVGGNKRPINTGQWPTLREMIQNNKRVVVITSGEIGASWNLQHSLYVRETDWDYSYREQMGYTLHADRTTCDDRCAKIRQKNFDAQFHTSIINQFLTFPIASPELAKQINFPEIIDVRLDHWYQKRHIRANHICVDFWEVGNVLHSVDRANEVDKHPFICRRIGRADILKKYCCPSDIWFTQCSASGYCNKKKGICVCKKIWGRGFDCSVRKFT
eukprot:gene1331-1929_t